MTEKEQQQYAILQARKRAYQISFETELGREVLQDLARFCRANQTTFHADPRVHAALEGRREVYLRIKDFLDFDMDTLFKKYAKGE